MKTYLVGGAVRDRMLDIPVYDHDWVVVGSTAEEMVDAGYQPVGKDFPVFLHPKTKEEYALARTERKSGHGYKGFAFYASPEVTLEDDLRRRDLTINAMAMDDTGHIVDPFNGQQDIENRTLRHVSEAFVEDPLRVLRVARFSARFHHLGFSLAPETLALMQQLAAQGELRHLTKERIWQELYRALGETSPEVFFEVLFYANALDELFPALQKSFIEKGPTECTQLLKAAATLTTSPELRLALLCYDNQLEDTELNQLLARINATKVCQRCCQLISQQLEHLTALPCLSPQQQLDLYRQIDPLRRPEQLEWMQQALDALAVSHRDSTEAKGKNHGANVDVKHLTRSLESLIAAVESISPSELVASGFSGKALGSELQRRQLQAIAQITS